jgi:Acetyltransferase (GNAT) family
LGRWLVEYAIERAKEAGVSRVDLTARATRRAAHALYLSLGFEQRETTSFRLRITSEQALTRPRLCRGTVPRGRTASLRSYAWRGKPETGSRLRPF